MDGNPLVINALNINLANEITAINQYIVHAGIVRNWGYTKLADYIQARADEEREHSQKLIDRIRFLNGIPIASKINYVNIAYDVPTQFLNDKTKELESIKSYNDAIALCVEIGDNSTRSYLEEILNDEINHELIIEGNLTQIDQMTLQNYLSIQV